METGLYLHGGTQPLQFCGGQGPISYGGDYLAQGLDAHIARGIEAICCGLLAAVCEDIALLVQFRQAPDQFRGRLIPGKDEDAEGFSVCRVVLGHLAGLGIPVPEEAQGGIPGHFFNFCIRENRDFLVVPCGVRRGLGAGEVVAPDQDGHMAGVLGEEHALLRRGKAAAHHKDVLAGEELAVAGGAVGHAPAAKLLLPLETHHAGMSPGGQQHAEALQVTPAGPDGFHIAGEIQAGDLGQQELRAETFRLLPHGFGELRSAGPAHAWIVDHLCGNGDLAAEVVFLHHDHPVAGPGQVQGSGEARRSAADHHHIIEVFHLYHGLQLAHQVQAGLQGLRAGLPLGRAHLISVLRHKLAGLDLPQQFIGVAAHIAGVDLIGYDLPLGVYNETAPLRHAVGLDIDLEIFGQAVGGVGQHGEPDLLDALRGVVPGLVDIVCVAGNGVDLAARGLELVVEVGKVLQLCGADEGKVGGVEEEHAPLTQDVRPGDGSEGIVLVALDGKIRNFFLDQGHNSSSLHHFTHG